MHPSPVTLARALHAALESGAHGEALRPLFSPDAEIIERPNLVKPAGARTPLEGLLANSSAGARLLAWQRFEVHSAIAHDALAIVRLTWSGEIAEDVGPFRRGQLLTAHIAQFVETRA